jgi:hypothetical protein
MRAVLSWRYLASGMAEHSPHTSKTLTPQELETLLAAVPADASAKAYRTAFQEEDVLGKGTLSARKGTASRLTTLQGLDPTKPLLRVLRRLWGIAATTHLALTSYSQMVCGCSCMWDLPLASGLTPSSEEEG